jgi:hypothetical protein
VGLISLADPVVGISSLWYFPHCLGIRKAVFTRNADGIDPEIIDEIRHAVNRAREFKTLRKCE